MKKQIYILWDALKNVWGNAIRSYNGVINRDVINPFWAYSAVISLCGYISCICFFGDYNTDVFPLFNTFIIPLVFIFSFCLIGKMFFLLKEENISVFTAQDSSALSPLLVGGFIFFFYLVLICIIRFRDIPDVRNQLNQIDCRRFDDWHPVIHTYSLYLLSLVCSYVYFLQVCTNFLFALVCAWLYAAMIRYSFNRMFALVIIVLIALNPNSVCVMSTIQKDAAFHIHPAFCRENAIFDKD